MIGATLSGGGQPTRKKKGKYLRQEKRKELFHAKRARHLRRSRGRLQSTESVSFNVLVWITNNEGSVFQAA